MTTLAVRAADPKQWPAALEVLFQHHDTAARRQLGVRTEALLRAGELDPCGLFIAERSSHIMGALLCTPAPGAVGLVWPPQAVTRHEQTQIEDELARAALAWLRSQGTKLAQTMVRAEDAAQAGPLLRHGFERVTTLLYLRRALLEPLQGTGTSLRFEPYTLEIAVHFAETLARTYEGTHDCPEVNGVRTVDEVLTGHRAQGAFATDRWWLVHEDPSRQPSPHRGEGANRPLGVLLVNALAEEPGWEIIYMGVVPEARGRGLGRQLTQRALQAARDAAVPHMDLCVDCRNLFARHVYESLGFAPIGTRVVFLARLDSSGIGRQL